MSKQPSNTTKQRLLRRGLAGILSLALILGLLPSTLFTSAGAASWATPYVNTLVDWGVMRGDIGGNMAPDRSITRAEFVAMMNRAYGYSKLGGHPFTDVRVRDWYNEDIDIGYNIGYFKGTGPTTASPNDTLTREQAAVLLARNMMLQETVGETLGFSDSRTLSDWSRGLVGAAASHGIISGYDDGTFKPFNNITRGEVAAMLVRAIGTPIQTAGDHALGNVYGNVTVNTSGVKLRDGVIVGNLYLTGGIDLGDVLLENITVLGEIVVSGGGESNSSQSSIIMRNVTADSMVVDSIGSQFVTIRAEGDTDIPTTTVRTNAYVDDSALPGYGLSHIVLDGEDGALYQLAGNIKEVINKTPGSDMQFVQGTANKVTVDEEAKDSSVLIDGDAVVDELDLDTATTVTGTGDIGQLNVGAAGSTVEQLPDKIEIRPGITTEINGSEMNSTQAAESSSEPKLLAGYPAVRKIAPTKAELVFKTNKTGTIYWAVSAVADGSVSEDDLLEPPAYGNKIVASGNVAANAANKEFTAAVTGLTTGGSYYVTAMLVDGRNQRSPIKVTSFTTPDDTVPAFAQGYPVMSKVTCDEAQVTVMTTKSCLLYYALLPKGAAAPKPEEFKSAAIPGNLGYGSLSVNKNVTMPFPVNDTLLDEKTDYVLYLWLTDHDGAKSSSVVSLPFTTPDETPPVVTSMEQINESPTSIQMSYTIDEPADLVWAIVTEGDHMTKRFLDWTDVRPGVDDDHKILDFGGDAAALLAAKVRLMSGTGALQSGNTTNRSPFTISNLPTTTSSYVLYYMANDNATASGNLSDQIKAVWVHTEDNIPPTATLRFVNSDGTEVTENPQSDAEIHIVFSESVKGTATKNKDVFLSKYQAVEDAQKALDDVDPGSDAATDARDALASAMREYVAALSGYITLYTGTPDGSHAEVPTKDKDDTGSWINWEFSRVEMMDDGSGRVRVILPGPDTAGATPDYSKSAVKLDSGASYYFHLAGIYDLAVVANPLDPSPCNLPFTTSFAQVQLDVTSNRPAIMAAAVDKNGAPLFTNASTVNNTVASNIQNAALYPNAGANDPARIDRSFRVQPLFTADSVGSNIYYEILIWADTDMEITLYSRPYGQNVNWVREGSTVIRNTAGEPGGFAYRSLFYDINDGRSYGVLKELAEQDMEYAIHVDRLAQGNTLSSDFKSWNGTVNLKVSVVAGWSDYDLNRLTQIGEKYQETYDRLIPATLRSIGTPENFPMEVTFIDAEVPEITRISIVDSDTSPVITLGIKPGGAVDYLIFPLTELQYQKQDGSLDTLPSGIQITEAMIRGTDPTYSIVSYNAPTSIRTMAAPDAEAAIQDITPIRGASPVSGTELSIPEGEQVRLGLTNSTGVIKGSTNSVTISESARIELNGLEPNTVYVLLAATRGSTSKSFAETAVAYRFTTSMPSRPVITLDGGSTDVTATVDRTSTLRARLLVQSQIETQENSIFAKRLGDTGNFDPNAGALPAEYEDYTILKALYESVSSRHSTPGRNGRYPSVFDVYASPDMKQDVQAVVETGGTMGNTSVGTWGGEGKLVEVDGTSNFAEIEFDTEGLYVDTDYVCIAMARSATTGAYAFRADYPLQVLGNQPPDIVASGSFARGADDKWAEGEITVTFDQTLWRKSVGDNIKMYPVEHDASYSTTASGGCLGLGACFDYPSFLEIPQLNKGVAPISSVRFKLKNATALNGFTITLNAGNLFNQWGTAIPRTVIDVVINEDGSATCTYR